MSENKRTLLFGIGNCGRADDGLGWAFLDEIERNLPSNFDIEYRYQLQVEDAEIAQNYDTIIFIDAHIATFDSGFEWKICIPKASDTYTSHELNPETILHLTKTIYNKQPTAFTLGITGVNYELALGLSSVASNNLTKALDYFNKNILNLITAK